MGEQEKHKQLDELLDSMLSQYAAEEPRPGLETRVLATIAESRRSGPLNVWRWLWLGTGAAAIVALVIVLLVSTKSRSNLPVAAISQNQQHQSSPQASLANRELSGASRPSVGYGKRSIRRIRVLEVRQDVFPSPEPLSEQEKLMLRYLSATPRQELLAQSHPDPLLDDLALTDESQPRY